MRKVLLELMEAARDCDSRGGKVAGHHLAFDAGIIAEELNRAGLGYLIEEWSSIVKKGLCTMDPDTACAVRGREGVKDCNGKSISWNVPVGLKDMVSFMAPDHAQLREAHHDAGTDAVMCWRVCQGLATQREALSAYLPG